MFTGPQTPSTDPAETTTAPHSTTQQALSPLERILQRLDTLVSRATPASTSSNSQPGRISDYDEGRDGSGGRSGFKQGPRTSPIAGASVGNDVSHYPTRLPVPDTTGPTGSSSLSNLGHLPPTLSSSSSGQNLQSSNILHEIRVPLSHSPHGRATVPVLGVPTTRDQVQGYNMLEDLSKADEALRHFSQGGGDPLQNFSSANANATGAQYITPMVKIVKYDYPKLVEDPALFETWRSRFIASICATELAPLYDRATGSIVQYGTYVEDEHFHKYEIQLYSRILQALPDSSDFIKSTEYLSRGIALWHALLEDNNSTGAVHNTHLLLPALYSMHRKQHESVDAYWNRFFHHVQHIRRDRMAPSLSSSHLRLKFLITLGGTEFSFLKIHWENSSLDPKWMSYSDDELKSALRLIQQAKSSSLTGTVAHYGFVNAVHGTTQNPVIPTTAEHANAVKGITPSPVTQITDKDPRIDTLCTLVAEQAKLLTEHSTTLSKLLVTSDSKTSKYCWTHGGCNHTSADCRTKATGHQDSATWRNRMGGSERNMRRK